VLVLVLEMVGTLTRRVFSQRPGGEPLWHVAGDLAIFCFGAPSGQIMSQRGGSRE
jgi:hypothetical protein